jgi:hypothetical protein
MKFSEINLFGVYVAPISILIVGAWLVLILLRHAAGRLGLLNFVWHPSLFVFAIYILVLAAIVFLVAR